MKRRRLGRSGLVVSEICLGTMTFGSMADEATSIAIMDRAFEGGVDFLDAAETYPVPPSPKTAGRTEEIVGRWLGRHPRDAVIVATKIAGPGGGWFPSVVRHGKTTLDRHAIELRSTPASGGCGPTTSTSTRRTGRIPSCRSRRRSKGSRVSSRRARCASRDAATRRRTGS